MRSGQPRWSLFFLLALSTTPLASFAQLGLGDVPDLEAGTPIKRVESLRFQLDVLLEAERDPIEDLNQGYLRALEKLESRLQASGRLPELLAVRKELENFNADPDSYLPPEATEQESGLPGLEQLRSTYRRERLSRNREVARRSREPLVKIKQELQDLQVELTKADRIDDALVAVQTIEAIDKRLAGIENGVVPAFLGEPLPKTKEQLEQFLVGTKWISGWGAYVELLADGTYRQSNNKNNKEWKWKALSSDQAHRVGISPGEWWHMRFNEDFSFFSQQFIPDKRFYRVTMPVPPETNSPDWGTEELEAFLHGSVWVKDDTEEWVTVCFAGEKCITATSSPAQWTRVPWKAVSELKATAQAGKDQVTMAFSRDLRSFEQVAPGNKDRATFRLVGKASIPEE